MSFFGDDHGGEAVVDRRDTYWASGGSAVTNSLILSAVWVVRAVFADRNAPALCGILNQQGVGNSTVYGNNCQAQCVYYFIINYFGLRIIEVEGNVRLQKIIANDKKGYY